MGLQWVEVGWGGFGLEMGGFGLKMSGFELDLSWIWLIWGGIRLVKRLPQGGLRYLGIKHPQEGERPY